MLLNDIQLLESLRKPSNHWQANHKRTRNRKHSHAYMIFEISNCSFSTHFQTLATGWRYVITPPPLVNLFLSKPICCFLLIETLQFTIPVEKISHKLHMKWGFQAKGYDQRKGDSIITFFHLIAKLLQLGWIAFLYLH